MEDKAKRGLQASVEGFAHEHIAAGLLMKKYQNVSLVNLPLSPYDIVVVLRENGRENIIRVQVKTARHTISFRGGVRGGVDRTYKSGVKEYTQSPLTSDVVIGLCPINSDKNAFDLYFVPTILIAHLGQKSISLKKIKQLKNNYAILERCKDKEFVLIRCEEYGIIN